jgi:hypothetical protein
VRYNSLNSLSSITSHVIILDKYSFHFFCLCYT